MDDTQLMKGILEGCILAVIAEGETYGYEILQVLSSAGFSDIQEGTLYPILTRLEKKSCIVCRKEKSPLGPIRKYFTVTEEGSKQLEAFRESYRLITRNAKKILFDTEENYENRCICNDEG